jgi:hypothetical protein
MTLPPVEMVLEVALGKGPFDTITEADWTDLSARMLTHEMTRGREDRTAEYEPGVLTVELDNSDGLLDHFSPGSLIGPTVEASLCPVRLRARYDGDLHPIFYGYTGPECWEPTESRVGVDGSVLLNAVDALSVLANANLPSGRYASLLTQMKPDWWIRGLNGALAAGNNAPLTDSSGNAHTSVVSAPGSDVMFEVESLVPSDPDSAMRPVASVFGYSDATALTGAATNVSMAVVWKGTASGSNQTIMGQQVGSTLRWRVQCTTAGQMVLTAYDTSGTATSFIGAPTNLDPDSSGRWDDDKPHLVVIRIQGGTGMRIWVDGRTDSIATSIPASMTGRVRFGGGPQTADFDEPAYWNRAITLNEADKLLQAWREDGDAPFAGDSLEGRVERWLEIAGMDLPLEVRNGTSDGDLAGLRQMPGQSVADALRVTADSYYGAVWVDRAGVLRVRSSTAFANSAYSDDYVTQAANLTDEASPASSPTPVRRSRLGWSGRQLDKVVNAVRVAWLDFSFTRRSLASIARYGERLEERTSELQSGTEAAALASSSLSVRSSPPVEMRTVTIDPSVDAGAREFAIKDLELERRVGVSWAPHPASRQWVDVEDATDLATLPTAIDESLYRVATATETGGDYDFAFEPPPSGTPLEFRTIHTFGGSDFGASSIDRQLWFTAALRDMADSVSTQTPFGINLTTGGVLREVYTNQVLRTGLDGPSANVLMDGATVEFRGTVAEITTPTTDGLLSRVVARFSDSAGRVLFERVFTNRVFAAQEWQIGSGTTPNSGSTVVDWQVEWGMEAPRLSLGTNVLAERWEWVDGKKWTIELALGTP